MEGMLVLNTTQGPGSVFDTLGKDFSLGYGLPEIGTSMDQLENSQGSRPQDLCLIFHGQFLAFTLTSNSQSKPVLDLAASVVFSKGNCSLFGFLCSQVLWYSLSSSSM